MKNDVILLLDTFFYILIWHGDTIIMWKEQEYHLKEGYEGFKQMLESPWEEANLIMQDWFPVPWYFLSKPGDGAEWKIKAWVNPSNLQADNSTVESGNFFTEDVSLKVFMQHLIKLAVQSN